MGLSNVSHFGSTDKARNSEEQHVYSLEGSANIEVSRVRNMSNVTEARPRFRKSVDSSSVKGARRLELLAL